MEQFEDQVILEARDIVSSRSKKPSTEVVPFLVPAAKNAKVIIGDRDIDSVSELEEEMSVGSPEEESEEDEDAVIPASVTRAAEAEPRSRLQLVSRPGDTRAEAGRVVAMSCEVTGDKPIGEWQPRAGTRDTWLSVVIRRVLVPRRHAAGAGQQGGRGAGGGQTRAAAVQVGGSVARGQ